MKEELRAVAWRKQEEEHLYTLQIHSGSNRALSLAAEEVSGTIAGKGYNPKTKQSILILEKKFNSKKEWLRFAKTLSFKLSEISSRTGRERIINEGK